MSAPAAVDHQAALGQLGRALASAAERTAVDSAAPSRPLAASDHAAIQHEAAPSLAGTRDGLEEDDRRVSTSTAV